MVDNPPSQPGEPLKAGSRLGHWKLVRPIGKGGFGYVWLAERDDDDLTMTAAIKLLDHSIAKPSSISRFRRERQILADLKHPYISMLIDGGTTEVGQPYFVMEYVQGLGIEAFSEKHELSNREILRLMIKICHAVAFAHENGIVHRDIKYNNIMIIETGTSRTGAPKLLDFGIAATLDDCLEDDMPMAMTPEFAAPEQRHGEAATPAMDVYAIGLVLLGLITKKRPREFGEHPVLALPKVLDDHSLEPVLTRCLAIDPSDRFNHVQDLISSLREILDQRTETQVYSQELFIWAHPDDKEEAASLTYQINHHCGLRTRLYTDEDPNSLWSMASESRSCIVFLKDWQRPPWQNRDLLATMARAASGLQWYPVAMEPAHRPQRESDLPRFMRGHTWTMFTKPDDPDGLERLAEAINACREKETPQTGPQNCPFPGLMPFDEEDNAFFFGREALVDQILERLDQHHLAAVLGPSGSGKSSMVRAGLLPELRKQGHLIAIMKPSEAPVQELADCLSLHYQDETAAGENTLFEVLMSSDRGLHFSARELTFDTPDKRLCLIVDQAEELFTMAHEAQARAFASLLVRALEEKGPITVILTMRSDFLGHCARWPHFNNFLVDNLVQVAPMERNQLHQAIVRPLIMVGTGYEAGLPETLMVDLDKQPGALPLLQHTLRELWERRSEQRLTHTAYRALGGLSGALEQRIESLFQAFDTAQQKACRQIFLRLVKHEGGVAARRRAFRWELLSHGQEQAINHVIETLVKSRLLVMHGEALGHTTRIEVAHEALLVHWPRMIRWLESEQDFLRFRHSLTEVANQWIKHQRQKDYLLRGGRLAECERWFDEGEARFNRIEHDFYDASIALREAEHQKEQETQRILKRRAVLSMIGGSLATVLAVIAIILFYNANQSEKKALDSKAAAQESEKETNELVLFMADEISSRLIEYDLLDLSETINDRLVPHLAVKSPEHLTLEENLRHIKILDNVAKAHTKKGNYQKALEAYKESLKRLEYATSQDPDNEQLQFNLAYTHSYTSDAYRIINNFQLLEAHFQEYFKIVSTWAKLTDNDIWQEEQIYAIASKSRMLFKKAELEEALKYTIEACHLYEERLKVLEENDPKAYQRTLFGYIDESRTTATWALSYGSIEQAFYYHGIGASFTDQILAKNPKVPKYLRLKQRFLWLEGELTLMTGQHKRNEQVARSYLQGAENLIQMEPNQMASKRDRYHKWIPILFSHLERSAYGDALRIVDDVRPNLEKALAASEGISPTTVALFFALSSQIELKRDLDRAQKDALLSLQNIPGSNLSYQPQSTLSLILLGERQTEDARCWFELAKETLPFPKHYPSYAVDLAWARLLLAENKKSEAHHFLLRLKETGFNTKLLRESLALAEEGKD